MIGFAVSATSHRRFDSERKCIPSAVGFGQIFGSRLADVADAQREYEAIKRQFAARFDGAKKLIKRFFAEAFQARQLRA